MAQYKDTNILDSKGDVLCFAASSFMRPQDVHGGKSIDIAPMSNMSALASALYDYEPKLATIMAAQMQKGRMFYQQYRLFMMLIIKLDDGRMVSPFIVRRSTYDKIDPNLVVLSTDTLFRWMLPRVKEGFEYKYALERPIDATPEYDKLVALLPDYVTIHPERRYPYEPENQS